MFIHRALQTSHLSSFSRCRSALCIAGLAMFALGMSSTAFATTYNASSENCSTVSPDGSANYSLTPSTSNPGQMFSYNDTLNGGAKEQCVWSGFAPSGTKFTTASTLTITAQFTFNSPCAHTSAFGGVVASSGGTVGSHVNAGPTTYTISIPANTDLSTFTATGTALSGPNSGCNVETSLTRLDITH